MIARLFLYVDFKEQWGEYGKLKHLEYMFRFVTIVTSASVLVTNVMFLLFVCKVSCVCVQKY